MSYPHFSPDCWEHHSVVKDFKGEADEPQPIIVCLCGSTRFYEAFQKANYDETMAGRIVLSVGFYPHSAAATGHGEGVGHDSAEKIKLDELHKRKIDLCDEVLVLNVGPDTSVYPPRARSGLCSSYWTPRFAIWRPVYDPIHHLVRRECEMSDNALTKEARDLIAFYDANGWNWESALAFTLCRDICGDRMRIHPIDGYRCYPYPKGERL